MAREARDWERGMGRCGHHSSEAFDLSHARLVDHVRRACEDCRAEKSAREQWHKEQRHPDKGSCACDDEVFWISDRVSIESGP